MAAEDNAKLIERFYAAFASRDGETMAACYAPDATFSDPVFPDLSGYEGRRPAACALHDESFRAVRRRAPRG
ncbi:MAG: nuclear transport factor 2 family protein [Solirubrobacterales bacterium]